MSSSNFSEWTRLLGSNGSDFVSALTKGTEGSVYIAGYTNSNSFDGQINSGQYDAFLSKFNLDGTKAWTKLLGTEEQLEL